MCNGCNYRTGMFVSVEMDGYGVKKVEVIKVLQRITCKLMFCCRPQHMKAQIPVLR